MQDKITFNIYDALGAMYDARVNGLARKAIQKDLVADKNFSFELNEFSALADYYRQKAKNVKTITGTKADFDACQRRAQSIDLAIRRYDENSFFVIDKNSGYILPTMLMTLKEISDWLDLSGVADVNSETAAPLDENEPPF